MARKPATEAQRSIVRKGIQKAAAGLYADKGLAAISARAVAERAGVSVGTLYAYFDNLQTLMQSLWMEPVGRLASIFTEVADATPDPAPRLRALLETYVGFASRNPEFYRGAFLFVRPQTLPAPDRAALDSEVFPALLIRALEDGQRAGVFRAGDPRRLAQILWAGLHGCFAMPTNFDRLAIDAPEALAADMINDLISAVRT